MPRAPTNSCPALEGLRSGAGLDALRDSWEETEEWRCMGEESGLGGGCCVCWGLCCKKPRSNRSVLLGDRTVLRCCCCLVVVLMGTAALLWLVRLWAVVVPEVEVAIGEQVGLLLVSSSLMPFSSSLILARVSCFTTGSAQRRTALVLEDASLLHGGGSITSAGEKSERERKRNWARFPFVCLVRRRRARRAGTKKPRDEDRSVPWQLGVAMYVGLTVWLLLWIDGWRCALLFACLCLAWRHPLRLLGDLAGCRCGGLPTLLNTSLSPVRRHSLAPIVSRSRPVCAKMSVNGKISTYLLSKNVFVKVTFGSRHRC